MERDLERLEKITDIFIRKHGYLIADSETNIPSFNSPYIYQVASDITYPVEVKNYLINLNTQCEKYRLTGKNCEFSCVDLLGRYPVLKTSQMTFKIIYLER